MKFCLAFLITILILAGCSHAPFGNGLHLPDKTFIIGQDLDAIRGYEKSDCCIKPDAATAYLSFFNLLDKSQGYGGLGLNEQGEPIELEWDWGSGPVNAYKTGKEFGFESLAIGLSITENEHPGALPLLVAGEYDANILQLVHFVKLFEGDIYLRIGYEFDGFWNQGYEDAPRYIKAWKRIVNTMRSAGADNVQFVWQASASQTDDILDGHHDDIRAWYPGDNHVDWLGFSMFAHPEGPTLVEMDYQPALPQELIQEVLDMARELGKPVMIAEAAPRAFNLNEMHKSHHSPIYDGDAGTGRFAVTADDVWASYYGPLFRIMNENSDVIRSLAYINVHWDSQEMWGPPYESGYWGDSRLEVNPELAKRFSNAIKHWKTTP